MSYSVQEAFQLGLEASQGNTDLASPLANSVYGLTFRESKNLPYHRWYPYVEGFASNYVGHRILSEGKQIKRIYDPFGGAGTSMLTASCLGIESGYSEVNKFMQFVSDAKINSTATIFAQEKRIDNIFDEYLGELQNRIAFEKRAKAVCLTQYANAFNGKDFFAIPHLRRLLAARDLAQEVFHDEQDILKIVLLAIASNVVKASNMTRRADLRRRRPDEYKDRIIDVPLFITDKLRQIQDDLLKCALKPLRRTFLVTDDSRQLDEGYVCTFDMAITSPPYLNGTNYCRNTKLEQWFLGFLSHESGLEKLRKKLVCAGINNVTKNRNIHHSFPKVEHIASLLDDCALDKRIPLLVRGYFSDMYNVFKTVYSYLSPGSRFYLDIGDSVFYGVHVKTDELLQDVARQVGFSLVQKNMLAKRYSRDRTPLVQVELVFEKGL